MRTLKKTLCLVLAVVMILGLGVIGVSAKDYTDAESVEHKEAVAILSAVGVFEGDDNGAFNGSKALTRAEGAAVVTRLLGIENPNGATTFADTENHWARGYIAYCADLGIMNGYGDGNFGPDDPLTGAAFAKFLLVALGYNPNQENMTGASWEIGVTKLVNVIDLAHDMGGLSYTGAITRDDAAKLAYNCLKENMVEYVNNKTITAGDVSVVENYEATPVKNASYSYKMNSNHADYTAHWDNNANEIHYMQFVENYFPNLKLENTTDDFGVPQNYWYLAKSRTDYARDKDEDIVKEAADDLLATFTDAVTPKTIRDAIGGSAVDVLTWNSGLTRDADHQYNGGLMNVWIDGVNIGKYAYENDEDGENAYYDDGSKAISHWAGTANGSSDNISELGRGVITRVYRNNDTQDVNIVVNGVYLVKATADFSGDELPIINNNDGHGIYNAGHEDDVDYADGRIFPTEIKQDDVDVSSFKKDDWLLVTATATKDKEWKFQTAELAEVVEDTTLNSYRYVPQFNKGVAGNIVAGGKYYMFNLSAEVNAKAKGYELYVDPLGDSTGDLKVNDNSYKFWLDKNGYIVGLEEVESSVKAEDYLYVTAVDVSTLEAKAKVVFLADGTEKTITVSKLTDINDKGYKSSDRAIQDGDEAGSYNSGDGTLTSGYFYKFKEKSSGEYELTKIALKGEAGTKKVHQQQGITGTMKAGQSKPINTVSYTANAKSVAVADKKTYVGVRNFPNVGATYTKSGVDYTTTYGVLYDEKSVIIAAYTDGTGTGTADKNQYALLIGGPSHGKDGDDDIWTYDAIINGEVTRVVVSEDSDDQFENNPLTVLVNIGTTDSKGNAKLVADDLVVVPNDHNDLVMGAYKATAASGDYGISTSVKTYKFDVDKDVLTYDEKSIAVVDSNTKFYKVDNTDGHSFEMKSMEGSTAANLNTNSNWLVYILKDSSNDKTASIVYFVELSGTKFAVGPDSDGNYLITNNYSDLEDLGPGNTKLGEVIIP